MNKTRMAPVEVNGLYPPIFSLMLTPFFDGIPIKYVKLMSLDWVKRHKTLINSGMTKVDKSGYPL